MDNDKDKIEMASSCRDCTVSSLFSLVRLLVYVLSAIAISNNSSEIIKNVWSLVK